jgi:hypothetical protein
MVLNFFSVLVVSYWFTVLTRDSFWSIYIAPMYFSKLLKYHSGTVEKQLNLFVAFEYVLLV